MGDEGSKALVPAPMTTQRLGRTELEVPIVGVGTAFLGYTDAIAAHGPIGSAAVDEEFGAQTLLAAIEAGARLVDTAPLYSDLAAERIVGLVMRAHPELRASCTVTTKIGSFVGRRDYRRDAVVASVHESLERCGLERFPLVSVHDAQGVPLEEVLGRSGALAGLRSLQDEGLVGSVGTACSDLETNVELAATGEFDVAVVPGGWSLLSQKAGAKLLPVARRHDLGVIVATPLERGLLATGPIPGQPHRARNFGEDALEYLRMLMAVCERHGVTLLAAALQWPSRHPQVASTIPGPRTVEEAIANSAAGSMDLGDEFWDELLPLVRDWDYSTEILTAPPR